jgi:hypothetical protein
VPGGEGLLHGLPAAALLLGACLQRAFNRQFSNQKPDASADDCFITDLVATLMQGLQPPR